MHAAVHMKLLHVLTSSNGILNPYCYYVYVLAHIHVDTGVAVDLGRICSTGVTFDLRLQHLCIFAGL